MIKGYEFGFEMGKSGYAGTRRLVSTWNGGPQDWLGSGRSLGSEQVVPEETEPRRVWEQGPQRREPCRLA